MIVGPPSFATVPKPTLLLTLHRLIREEARRQAGKTHGSGTGVVEVPFSRIVELTAKYNVVVSRYVIVLC